MNWHGLTIRGLERPLLGHGANATTRLNPLVNENNGIPFNAHNDFVRFFFEAGVVGLIGYVMYALLLCLWALRRARSSGAAGAAVAAALAAMLLLTAGMPEVSLHTANLYGLYGMMAVVMAGRSVEVLHGAEEPRRPVPTLEGWARHITAPRGSVVMGPCFSMGTVPAGRSHSSSTLSTPPAPPPATSRS